MTDEHLENQRDKHAPKFSVEVRERCTIIHYDGEKFVEIKFARGLPRGFHERLVQHVFDMLTAKRTALWDEQVVFGEHPRDMNIVRKKGRYQADYNLRKIEEANSGKG